ncbi:MAG: amidohydrolase family protein [Acetatifactor sp.]|nr:amidohydrolase family protein [Acetatifactor sp.]
MIIDIHTHTFPESVAKKAIDSLSASANMNACLDGSENALKASMEEAGIDLSLVMPVATAPSQTEKINRNVFITNERMNETGIESFGAIHPENSDYREIIKNLASENVRGIKIHPVFQNVFLDDIRYKRIIDCACEYDLAIMTHAGYDIGFPGDYRSGVSHILSVIKELKPRKLILAHMGGWDEWEKVLDEIAGLDVYLDTSFSVTKLRKKSGEIETMLHPDLFKEIVKKHGAGHILFGSDSPWASQKEALETVKEIIDGSSITEKILGQNALGLLGGI